MIIQDVQTLIDSKTQLLPETRRKLKEINYLETKNIYYDPDLSRQFNSRFKNLNLIINIVNEESLNAFTIPGISDYSKFLKNPNQCYYDGITYLYDHPINAKLVDNKIQFNRKISILVFIHSGLIKKFNKEEVFAIVLHEIGHWVDLAPTPFSNLLKKLQGLFGSKPFEQIEIPNLLLASAEGIHNPIFWVYRSLITCLLIFCNFKTRQIEYSADDFAKRMGYGKILYNALSKMEYKKVLSEKETLSFTLKFKSYFRYILSMVQSYFTGNTPSHPSTISRMDGLVTESLLRTFKTSVFGKLFQPIDNFLKNKIVNICPWLQL